jgi:hypothetical protein
LHQKSELQKAKRDAVKVYVVDETVISVAQGARKNALNVKGKKRVARMSSAERAFLMTLVTCMNAGEAFVRPLIVFPGQTETETA